MKPTLVILAAGMASRYGSMKQIQGFGPGGETIMDYSIYDAIRAGYGKIVFIIREEFAEKFKEIYLINDKGEYSLQPLVLNLNLPRKDANSAFFKAARKAALSEVEPFVAVRAAWINCPAS